MLISIGVRKVERAFLGLIRYSLEFYFNDWPFKVRSADVHDVLWFIHSAVK